MKNPMASRYATRIIMQKKSGFFFSDDFGLRSRPSLRQHFSQKEVYHIPRSWWHASFLTSIDELYSPPKNWFGEKRTVQPDELSPRKNTSKMCCISDDIGLRRVKEHRHSKMSLSRDVLSMRLSQLSRNNCQAIKSSVLVGRCYVWGTCPRVDTFFLFDGIQ